MIAAFSNNDQIQINISRPKDKNDIDAHAENIMQLVDELSGIYQGIYEIYGPEILFDMLDESVTKWKEGLKE